MIILKDADVGDAVTIEFTVTDRGCYVKNSGWSVPAAFSSDTVVKSIVKAPKFKVGDRVKADAKIDNYNNPIAITKTGTIKFLDKNRAWVSWEGNVNQAPHESLMKLDRLRKA